MAEHGMLISFTCENCGKHIRLEDRFRGRRGRCSQCGHVMRIPAPAAEALASPTPEKPLASADEPPQAPERAPFRISPPEMRPNVHRQQPIHSEPARAGEPSVQSPVGPHGSVFGLASPLAAAHERDMDEHHVGFDLLDDDSDADPASPCRRRSSAVCESSLSSRKTAAATRSRVSERGFFSEAGKREARGLVLCQMAGRRGLCAQDPPLDRQLGLSYLGPVRDSDDLWNRG